MYCFNKFLWVYLIFWGQPDCQNAGDARKFGRKAARPAGMWLNELCTSNVRLCKRVGSFIVKRFKNTFIKSACYCFASCL